MRIKKVNMILTKRKKYSILFLLMLSLMLTLTGCSRIASDPSKGSGNADLKSDTQSQAESDIRR